MIGAIAGDIIGSVYEFNQIKTKVFPLFHTDCTFTDDSVLTVAVAQATALAIYLARTGAKKGDIKREIVREFGYDLERGLEDIRPGYGFNETCQGTVPEAITAFLESESWEDAVRNAVSLGGDSDTLACITGGIAEAFFGGVPARVRAKVEQVLPADLWSITEQFSERYSGKGPTSRSTRTCRRRATP